MIFIKKKNDFYKKDIFNKNNVLVAKNNAFTKITL